MAPNVLMVMADQHRFDAMGCMGNPVVQTPNLDRLASESALFSNSYCQGPACQPARASLLTGRYAHQHEIIRNGIDFDPSWDTMAKRLQASGYYTGYIGKTHFNVTRLRQPCDLRENAPWTASFGFDTMFEEFDKPRHGPGYTTHYTEYLKSIGQYENYLTDLAPLFYDRDNLRPGQRYGNRDYQGLTSALPTEQDLTSFTAREAIRWLEEYDREQPFFLWVSFVAPHFPYIDAGKWAEVYKDADVPLGSQLPFDRSLKTAYNGHLNFLEMEGMLKEVNPQFATASIRHYYGSTSLVDEQVGAILSTLQRKGHDSDTWVIYTADHGDMLGDRGLWGKFIFNAPSVKIPSIVRPPGGIAAARYSEPIEAIDLSATILDVAQAPVSDLPGHSLVNRVNGGPRDATKTVAYSEIDGKGNDRWSPEPDPAQSVSMVNVATDQYRLTWDSLSQTPCELIDLIADPKEEVNLALDPMFESTYKDLYDEYIEPFLRT